jgi:hypothetical protein
MNKNKKSPKEIDEIVEKIDSAALKAIKETIGYGYVKKLQAFIKKREKKSLNETYIRIQMSLESKSTNRILYYALLLASELQPDKTEDLNQAEMFLKNHNAKYIEHGEK